MHKFSFRTLKWEKVKKLLFAHILTDLFCLKAIIDMFPWVFMAA